MRRKNKKAIEMGFDWIFAIIAGGFILFLAIYGASKFIKTQEQSLYTQTAEQLKSLFDPLETGLASGKSIEISFKKDTRTYYSCYNDNLPFGRQKIAFSEKTFGEEFGQKGGDITVRDKYIFAESIVEGNKIHLFSKPFFMPFKVADLLMISSKDYCFYNTPENIKNELEDLNLNNIQFENSSKECKGTSVCFDSSGCEITVFTSKNYVQKEGVKLYYQGNLIYAAIFSSPEIYECNVIRLMGKFNELGKIYLDKIEIIGRKQCFPTLDTKLVTVMNNAKNLKSSRDLEPLFGVVNEIGKINEEGKSGCRLF